jgi:hypothetical protein
MSASDSPLGWAIEVKCNESLFAVIETRQQPGQTEHVGRVSHSHLSTTSISSGAMVPSPLRSIMVKICRMECTFWSLVKRLHMKLTSWQKDTACVAAGAGLSALACILSRVNASTLERERLHAACACWLRLALSGWVGLGVREGGAGAGAGAGSGGDASKLAREDDDGVETASSASLLKENCHAANTGCSR